MAQKIEKTGGYENTNRLIGKNGENGENSDLLEGGRNEMQSSKIKWQNRGL